MMIGVIQRFLDLADRREGYSTHISRFFDAVARIKDVQEGLDLLAVVFERVPRLIQVSNIPGCLR